ncbi:hypothetical protein PR202_gb28287 [Eleusine coracana subsp. coracana]|uniref:Fe2OG dioxygenase domain-containing protein n=1 Tax=Eleusine coracana subsp. coracana TaxID=191504 RepID=A0AAV5FWX4_ELECO|nr:hypothetical protein PR202_gb28287 [Eleusine coracana subsp. coracana]
MGAELRRDDMEVAYEGFSDSWRFEMIARVLQSVRMDPFLVDLRDKEQYDFIVDIVDPTKKRSLDDEALLVAAVADQFLRESLQMLVNNFAPPGPLIPFIEQDRWLRRKKEIHSQLHESLKLISETVPLATRILKDIIDKSMPKLYDNKAKMVSFVECMLGLDTDRMGDLIGALLLAKIVDLLTELDVNITWEDILQEEHNKGIFDMELEDLDEDEDILGHEGTMALFGGNACAEKLDGLMVVMCEHLKSCQERGRLLQVRTICPKLCNEFFARLIRSCLGIRGYYYGTDLDGCTATWRFIAQNYSVEAGMEFENLKIIFRTSVLKLFRCCPFCDFFHCNLQFIMFYACSLDPEIYGLQFALFLTDLFTKKDDDVISRMSAVSYVGSFLSRARFISASIVVTILKKLVDWCVAYCDLQKDENTVIKPVNHQLFYASCQAVMYILCFRLRSIMDRPKLKNDISEMSFGYILTHKLQPLKVCLPAIVNEFLRQAKAAGLYNSSPKWIFEDAVESDLSKAFGGINRLDMFFPFDPYMLKESDRFVYLISMLVLDSTSSSIPLFDYFLHAYLYMRPNFKFWSKVKTTYSDNYDDDDELRDLDDDDDELGDVDADHVEIDINSDDDLEYSLNKMSITPHRTFYHPMTLNNATGLSMPAKIRPSCYTPIKPGKYGDLGKPMEGSNLWPEYPSKFEGLLENYVNQCRDLSRKIMRGIALALGGKVDAFEGKTAGDPFWVLRLIGYPVDIPEEQRTDTGCGAHTDYGFLTLVNQDDDICALEVQNQCGEWIHAKPIPGTFVCNIGDMLKVWSNGIYLPTLHRVVNNSPRYRVSVAFFYESNFDAAIEPVDFCRAKTGGVAKYDKVVYGKHLVQKVQTNFVM